MPSPEERGHLSCCSSKIDSSEHSTSEELYCKVARIDRTWNKSNCWVRLWIVHHLSSAFDIMDWTAPLDYFLGRKEDILQHLQIEWQAVSGVHIWLQKWHSQLLLPINAKSYQWTHHKLIQNCGTFTSVITSLVWNISVRSEENIIYGYQSQMGLQVNELLWCI